MIFLRTFSYIILISLALGCKGTPKKAAQKQPERQFPKVTVPAVLTDPADQENYLKAHYWDGFCALQDGVTDSTHVMGVPSGAFDQAFVNYLYLCTEIGDYTFAAETLQKFAESLLAPAFKYMANLTEKYLYDPNSPYRNEEVFLHCAEYLATCPLISEPEQEVYTRIARLCSLNRIGEVAADFRYTGKGRHGNLHGIQAEYIILFFSNPGCKDCLRVIEEFKACDKLTDLIASKRVVLLNCYPDNDIDAWLNYMPIYPRKWLNVFGSDFDLKDNTKYNIRAIPSIYLLDNEKRVILKDAESAQVIAYIQTL